MTFEKSCNNAEEYKLELVKNAKKYREFEIDYADFHSDLSEKKEQLKFADLELIFKDLKPFLLSNISIDWAFD